MHVNKVQNLQRIRSPVFRISYQWKCLCNTVQELKCVLKNHIPIEIVDCAVNRKGVFESTVMALSPYSVS
jgi:hypothetical protein